MNSQKPTYQPIVIECTENLIKGLEDADFFKDYEITDLTYTKNYLNELFTQKFINGELDDEETPFFSEEEFEVLLKEIAAGSVLYDLKKQGYVNSYEDDKTEEMFFLTKKGKEFLKKNNK